MEKVPLHEKMSLSPLEAAELLGVSRPTIYNMLHISDFPRLKVGSRVLINRERLQEWLDAHTGEEIAI